MLQCVAADRMLVERESLPIGGFKDFRQNVETKNHPKIGTTRVTRRQQKETGRISTAYACTAA